MISQCSHAGRDLGSRECTATVLRLQIVRDELSCCDTTEKNLRSVFRCDRKTAIERDHAATASDQTKFKVAEGRSKVVVRCDWGINKERPTRCSW